MFHLVRCLALALALAPALVRSTFQEDAGLDEALRVYLGPIFSAVPFGDAHFLVATTAGAIAKIDAETGAIAWRTVLPSSNTLDLASFSPDAIFTVSTVGNASELSQWSPTGALVSTRALGNGGKPASLAVSARGARSAVIMSDGSLHATGIHANALRGNLARSAAFAADGSLAVFATSSTSGAALWTAASSSSLLSAHALSGVAASSASPVAIFAGRVGSAAVVAVDDSSSLFLGCVAAGAAGDATVTTLPALGSAPTAVFVVDAHSAVVASDVGVAAVVLADGRTAFFSVDASQCIVSSAPLLVLDAVFFGAYAATLDRARNQLVVAVCDGACEGDADSTTTFFTAKLISESRSRAGEADQQPSLAPLVRRRGLGAGAGEVVAADGAPAALALHERGSSVFLLLSYDSGTSVGSSSSGRALWSRADGSACAADALIVDVAIGGDDGADSSAPSSFDAYDLNTRLASLALSAREAALVFVATSKDIGSLLITNPLRFFSSEKKDPTVGALAPSKKNGGLARSAQSLVALTRTDGGAPAVCRSRRRPALRSARVAGAVTVSRVDAVSPMWSRALPVSERVRAVRAESGVATPYTATLRDADAEILLVESGLDSTGGTWVHTATWLDAATGKTTRTTNLPSSSAPFSHAATLHNAHAASTTLALLTADSSTGALTAAQLVPHHADSQASSRTHFVAHVTYDALADSDVIEAVALNEGGGGPPVPVWRAPLGECSSRDHGMRVLAFSKSSLGAVDGRSRAKVRGDDGLLLNYLNPHLIAVVVGRRGPVDLTDDEARNRQRAGAPSLDRCASAPANATATLSLFLFDTVTGRMLHERRISGAVGPVSVALQRNSVIFSYWSLAAARTELGVASLYEGAVDPTALTPWSRNPLASRPENVSSVGAPLPIVVYKVFFLPGVGVRSLELTTTRAGITPPALLISTASDGVLSIDLRIIDPRRPLPAGADGAASSGAVTALDGLMPYSPHLPIRHGMLLNHGAPLYRVNTLLSAPTDWESVTFVAALGLDHFFARVTTARRFDQLERDFNSGLFLALMLASAAAMAVLHIWSTRKKLSAAWA